MIVAMGETTIGKSVIIGLTDADWEQMKKGLTKTKEGGRGYVFSSLVVFRGESDKQMIADITGANPKVKRADDLFPNVGSG